MPKHLFPATAGGLPQDSLDPPRRVAIAATSESLDWLVDENRRLNAALGERSGAAELLMIENDRLRAILAGRNRKG